MLFFLDTETNHESEKRPSENSLNFLINQLTAGESKNLRFLRGDWKVSEKKYNQIKEDLGKSGIKPKLVMKVEGEVETSQKITVTRPGKRYERNFLEKFPYLLSAKSYRYELTTDYQDEFYLSTFTGQNGPFYESESDASSHFLE